MSEVLISGARGLIGRALADRLRARGDRVRVLSRSPDTAPGHYGWNPEAGELDRASLDGVDAVVHLAGESIAAGRWTRERKRRILDSRSKGTELLGRAIAEASLPPRVWLSASAVGFYGDRGEDLVDESSRPGEGFLVDVCRAWEDATRPAKEAGVRVVSLRIGVVLDGSGGALAAMLTPFRFGLGGPVGSGRQFLSWITLRDTVGLILHALDTQTVAGPLNAVAPAPARSRDFARALGRVLSRPALLPLPALAVRALLGEMGERLLLDGARVSCERALASGYHFADPELEPALRSLLSRPPASGANPV